MKIKINDNELNIASTKTLDENVKTLKDSIDGVVADTNKIIDTKVNNLNSVKDLDPNNFDTSNGKTIIPSNFTNNALQTKAKNGVDAINELIAGGSGSGSSLKWNKLKISKDDKNPTKSPFLPNERYLICSLNKESITTSVDMSNGVVYMIETDNNGEFSLILDNFIGLDAIDSKSQQFSEEYIFRESNLFSKNGNIKYADLSINWYKTYDGKVSNPLNEKMAGSFTLTAISSANDDVTMRDLELMWASLGKAE